MMRKIICTLLFLSSAQCFGAADWTFLIFLNGNNNLSSWAIDDLIEMERVGSNDRVNIVVQWADITSKKTRRLLITKSTDPAKITSPVLEERGVVDMGDYRTLIDFVRWGVQHFPAERYFVNVWDHGTGWHAARLNEQGTPPIRVGDISQDDLSGKWITTQQLGWAMREASRIIGRKIDIYGSDACLMGMVEIASEMSDYVDYYIGSEIDIPLQGWPYEAFLRRWTASPKMHPLEVIKALTEEYKIFFSDKKYAKKGATLSAFNLAATPRMHEALKQLGREIAAIKDPAHRKVAINALIESTSFTMDYNDLYDLIVQLEKAQLPVLGIQTLNEAKAAIAEYVVANAVTDKWKRVGGVSIWFSSMQKFHKQYLPWYRTLKFSRATQWEDAVGNLLRH